MDVASTTIYVGIYVIGIVYAEVYMDATGKPLSVLFYRSGIGVSTSLIQAATQPQ